MPAGGEGLIQDGSDRLAEVSIVEIDDAINRFQGNELGRKRYQFGHWVLTIKDAPTQNAPISGQTRRTSQMNSR
jgi:hypothetical protein